MKNIFYIPALFAFCLSVLISCQSERLSTDQFDGEGVVLRAYGPQPVLRGGELRFLGINLDRVTAVKIPGIEPVTEIEVVAAGSNSEIRISVPVEGPQPGLLTLVTSDGQEIVTKTELTYSEPIVLDSFSPASVRPGDILTLKGDYLNLMHEVIFEEEVLVSEKDFLKHTRYEIQVKVPAEACTGQLGVGDVDEMDEANADLVPNRSYFEEELVVAAPEVTSVSAQRWKAGETVEVKGKNLDFVKSVVLPGAEVEELNVTENGEVLDFVLPAEAADGKIVLVALSGVEVVAGSYVAVVPTELAAEPEQVKAGEELTVSGKDLDMVTSVTLPGDVAVEAFEYSEGNIKFVVPDTAQEGDMVLGMANGKTVSTTYSLVKPSVTEYSANPAAAGSDLIVRGENLDLVKSVSFAGGAIVETADAKEGELTVAVPTTAESGVLTLNLNNGTYVTGPELAVAKPEACYVTELPAEGTEIFGGSVLILPVANEDKLAGVQVNGAETDFLLNGSSLYVSLPASAGKGTILKLISSNGSVEYVIDCIPGTVTNIELWSGSWSSGNWSGNQDLAWGGYDWASIDITGRKATLVFDFEIDPSQTWGTISLRVGDGWANLAGAEAQYDITSGQTVLEVAFTQEMLDDLNARNGLVLTGANYTLKKLTLKLE